MWYINEKPFQFKNREFIFLFIEKILFKEIVLVDHSMGSKCVEGYSPVSHKMRFLFDKNILMNL